MCSRAAGEAAVEAVAAEVEEAENHLSADLTEVRQGNKTKTRAMKRPGASRQTSGPLARSSENAKTARGLMKTCCGGATIARRYRDVTGVS